MSAATRATATVRLLDTNIISELMRHPAGLVAAKIRQLARELPDGEVCTSMVVDAELRFGLARKASTRLAEAYVRAMSMIDVRDMPASAAQIYADVRLHLERQGTPIGANDLLIAAHALALDATLVTDNEDEFRRVPGLAVENLAPDMKTPNLVIQGFVPPLKLADFKLIAFDMDSTLINIECIDEIADAAGKKAEVAAITDATMRGEIKDFKESLRRRVALLQGVPVGALQEVYDQRLRLNPGAEALVGACKAAGLKVLLVSGGFTFFADRVKERLAIDFARSNLLEEADGRLTGRVAAQSWGDICDGVEKRRTLLEVASLLGVSPDRTIAVGDGANDLPMMAEAGLSVAYHAKPKVREQAMVAIDDGGLDRLLEVLRP